MTTTIDPHPTIQTRSDMTVEFIDCMGDDAAIIQAMLVSTHGQVIEPEADYARIKFLMKNRHGTPFEHATMKWYVEAPIMVFREWHRHRIGFSYNETSGRYRELPPTFYVPDVDRPLKQVGKPGAYEFVPGSDLDHGLVVANLTNAYEEAYAAYQAMLGAGIAKEVARACLPVGLYSAMYVTCNPRSLMAFLSLRTRHPESMFPSFPQHEITVCAEALEHGFESQFPLTYRAFVECGRVCP